MSKKLESAIKKAKAGLIRKAQKRGLYENFGQIEVRKLDDKFIDCSVYTDEMNENRNLLKSFDDWGSHFDLSNI